MKIVLTLLAAPLALIMCVGLMAALCMIIFPIWFGFTFFASVESVLPQPYKGFYVIGTFLAFPLAFFITIQIQLFIEKCGVELDYVLGWGTAQMVTLMLLTLAFGA